MNTPPPDFFTVHCGDARRVSKLLQQYSSQREPLVSCTITSPPYANLKNYGPPDQIGWGQSYEEYLVEMRRVFRAVAQHTKPQGSMWVIADTLRPDEGRVSGTPQRLDLLPFRLADEAAEAGWTLRETVIWRKDKTLPWSTGSRFRNAFEYVLLFVKGAGYKFHVDRLRDPVQLEDWWVKWPERYNPQGKAPSNVWDIPIPVQGSWKTPAVQHACPLPPDLVERLLFLSTDPGDVVLDPFAGTGVVVAEAERLGRRGIGIELNAEYVRAFDRSVKQATLKRSDHDELAEALVRARHLREVIPKLRTVKYAKTLVQQLANTEPMLPRIRLVVATMGRLRTSISPETPIEVALVLAVDADAGTLDLVLHAAKQIADRRPASKFGIAASFQVCRPEDLEATVTRKRFHLYTRGRTWDAERAVRASDLLELSTREWPGRKGDYTYPAIVSNVEVHESPGRT